MVTKTTIEMAREAAGDDWGLFQEYMPEIHRLAELVRADERARMAEQPTTTENNGGKTGWPPGLLQDDCKGLSKWLSNRPDAKRRVREALAEQPAQQEPVSDTELINRGCHYQTELTKPAQQEPHVHAISGLTADELWLETGRLRSELADLKAQQQEPPAGCVVVSRAVLKTLGIDDAVIDTIARPAPQTAQQTIHCKHRRENNGVCPHHNLHCGWPKCNEPEQPAQQQSAERVEPVAVVSGYYGGQCVILPIDPARIFNSNTALYTSPPAQRKPLTDEEIRNIWSNGDCFEEIAFARAIEAAHGIKENT